MPDGEEMQMVRYRALAAVLVAAPWLAGAGRLHGEPRAADRGAGPGAAVGDRRRGRGGRPGRGRAADLRPPRPHQGRRCRHRPAAAPDPQVLAPPCPLSPSNQTRNPMPSRTRITLAAVAALALAGTRSEERRVGKECISG